MPPRKTQDPIAKPKLLAGEGQDELYFLEALVAHLGLWPWTSPAFDTLKQFLHSL
jgi:hypothetical protein